MQTQSQVIECLQECVALHWVAVMAYKSQQHHFQRLGYKKLADRAKDDVAEETEHLGRIMERLEEFDCSCDMEHDIYESPRMPDVKGILEFNLKLEREACDCERSCVTTARGVGDEITARLVAKNLQGSEDSIVELEAFLKQLEVVGQDNWLADKL